MFHMTPEIEKNCSRVFKRRPRKKKISYKRAKYYDYFFRSRKILVKCGDNVWREK